VADIFQEIDEELRQDRATKLWNRYGNYVIAAAVLIVLSVGGYKYWTARDLETRQAESATYQSAVAQAADGDVNAAISTLGNLARDAGFVPLPRGWRRRIRPSLERRWTPSPSRVIRGAPWRWNCKAFSRSRRAIPPLHGKFSPSCPMMLERRVACERGRPRC
jgi:hypothetical protein